MNDRGPKLIVFLHRAPDVLEYAEVRQDTSPFPHRVFPFRGRHDLNLYEVKS
jgi:hypothetical protein